MQSPLHWGRQLRAEQRGDSVSHSVSLKLTSFCEFVINGVVFFSRFCRNVQVGLGVLQSVIPKKQYGHIIILAAVLLVSCQKAPDAAQSSSSGANEAETAQRSEAEVTADTVLWVQLQKDLDSSKLKIGDHFTGEIAEDVLVGGKPAIPKGSKVKGRVTNSTTAQALGSAGLLSVVLDSVDVHGRSYNVTTKPVTLQGVTLQHTMPNQPANKVAADVRSAYAPKNGILQFFLTNAVRIRT